MNILYADGNSELLEPMRILLESEPNLLVDTASELRDAVELLHSKSYSVVISSYRLGKGYGPDLLRAIGSEGLHPVFVFFTDAQARTLAGACDGMRYHVISKEDYSIAALGKLLKFILEQDDTGKRRTGGRNADY